MNDDLHNIDDLFRKGIDGHEEDVPESVWDAVSNDLDKKQASYYRRKYKQLKRAALLLLLLCFLGGGYIIYTTTGEKKGDVFRATSRANEPLKPNEKSPGDFSEIEKTINGIPPEKEKTTNTTLHQLNNSSLPKNDSNLFTTSTATVSFNKPVKSNRGTASSPALSYQKTISRNDANKKAPSKAIVFLGKTQKQEEKALQKNKPQKINRLTAPFAMNTAASPEAAHGLAVIAGRNYTVPPFSMKALPVQQANILPVAKAPERKSKTKNEHEFSLSAFVSPNLSIDRMKDDNRLAGPGRNRNEFKQQEQSSASYTAGLLLNYSISKNMSLSTGLTVTSLSTSLAPTTLVAKPDNNGRARYELHCASGSAYITPKGSLQVNVGDTVKTSGTVSKLTYVSVPASIGFRINKGRFSFYPTVGAGVNFLTSGKTTTSLLKSNNAESATTTTSISGLKSTYVDGRLGMGVEYGLNKNISIGVKPNARLALTPINKETPVQSYQNFLSLEAGVRIKL